MMWNRRIVFQVLMVLLACTSAVVLLAAVANALD